MYFITSLYLLNLTKKIKKIKKIKIKNKILYSNFFSNLGKIYYLSFINTNQKVIKLNGTVIKLFKTFEFKDKSISFNTKKYFSYENFMQVSNYLVNLL